MARPLGPATGRVVRGTVSEFYAGTLIAWARLLLLDECLGPVRRYLADELGRSEFTLSSGRDTFPVHTGGIAYRRFQVEVPKAGECVADSSDEDLGRSVGLRPGLAATRRAAGCPTGDIHRRTLQQLSHCLPDHPFTDIMDQPDEACGALERWGKRHSRQRFG